MENRHIGLVLSASIVCLASGCAAGPRATLEIRNVDHAQLASPGQRSIERGKELLQRGQYADAISAFRKALRDEPDGAEANNGLAIAYDGIGRKDLARRYFELAVAEKPDEIRYRGNLASFFESNGQPELAAGLRDVPIVLASVEPSVEAAMPLAVAELPMVTVELDGTENDPIAAILAELSLDLVGQDDAAVVEQPVPQSAIIAVSNEQPVQTLEAVFRPTVTPAIMAAPINLPSMPLPHRDPLDGRMELFADLPRNDRRQPEGSGPYIERLSLGEVKLVTLPFSAKADVVVDLDKLGEKLAIWAEEEKRQVELKEKPGLRGRLAVQNAINRAAIDEAIASAASMAAVAEQMKVDFVYIAYDDDETANAEIAA